MRAFVAVAFAAGGLAGCGGTDYEVWVAFESPDVAANVEVVSVWLVEECPAADSIAVPPSAPVRTVVVRRGERADAFGDVPQGTYGVLAIAVRNDCRVVAAGCTPVNLDGDGRIDVTLADHLGAMACQNGEVCASGECFAQGTCAPDGDGCGPEMPCCTGTCAPETLSCVPVGGGG